MPNVAPLPFQNSSSPPAPSTAPTKSIGPTPKVKTSPSNPQPIASKALSLAPSTLPLTAIAPSSISERSNILIAPTETTFPQPPASLLSEAPTAPTESNPQFKAPAPYVPEIDVPILLTSDKAESIAPEPQWQNLHYFSSLQEIIDTINGSVKKRVTEYQENFAKLIQSSSNDETKKQVLLRLNPRPQFAWSRVSSEPVIELSSFSELINAVFEENNSDFKADSLFEEAISKLPPEIAEAAKSKSPLQLEGLWIEFPKTTTSETKPRLSIAVSIAIADATTNLRPFPANRVHLTFGDFQL
jgi:hypothetical protein